MPGKDLFDEVDEIMLPDEALDLEGLTSTPQTELEEKRQPTTAAIERNEYDQAKFQEMAGNVERLQYAIERNKGKYPLAEAVAADAFHSLRLPYPQQQEVSEEYEKAAAAVKAMLESKDYPPLHEMCKYDSLLSADAAAGITDMLIDAILREEEKQKAQEAAQGQPARKRGQGQGPAMGIGGAGDTDGNGQPQPGQGDAQAQIEARKEAFEQAMHRAVGKGMQRIKRQIEQESEALSYFGGGPNEVSGQGWNLGGGEYGRTGSPQKRLELLKKIINNPFLRAVLQNLGRHEHIARDAQLRKIDKPVDELAGITYGRDIQRLTPMSLAMLAIPEYQILFMKNYAVGRLQMHQLRGHERVNRGPVVVAIDTSSSMRNEKIEWAMTVYMTLMSVAREQQRDIYLINFSDTHYDRNLGKHVGSLKIDEFKKGIGDPEQVLDALTFGWWGGTAYQFWMEKAIELVNGSEYDKADLLLLTDGSAHVKPETEEALNNLRRTRGFRVNTVLFKPSWGDRKRVEEFSDDVFQLIDFKQDAQVLEKLYSI